MNRKSVVTASVLAALLAAGTAYAGEISLYSGTHYRGGELTLHGAASNLERSGYNDRAESVIVRSGRWEACTDADFSGQCVVLEPGNYSALQNPVFRSISSLREVGPYAVNERFYRYDDAARVYHAPVYSTAPVYTAPAYDARHRYSALEIYTLPGFRGSTMKFDNSATTLDKRVTDEGLGSLVIREGVWELCTGLDFNGTCRTYEPGRYGRLGSFEGAPIGSLRRIG
jgi:Beta/Gamma crystallin